VSGPISRPASWIARAIVSTSVAASLALLPAPAARAGDQATTTDPALAAAGWLAIQVETDPTLFGGTLADAIVAFAAVHAAGDATATALANLEAGLEAYISPSGDQRPGETAKVLLAAQIAGADPTAFGGHDLESELRAMLVTDPGPDLGRFASGSVADQAYAILALARTSGGVPVAAVDWLVAAACPSGEFSWDGTCPSGPGMEDSDTTGLAVQALMAAGETAASSAGVDWLLAAQDAGGGFVSFGTPNANSSGLAAQAVRAAGFADAADAAAAFVAGLQLGCDADPASIGAFEWAPGNLGFLVFTAPAAILAFGAPRMDLLSAAGSIADAPVLDCASAGPTPAAPTPSPPAASPTSSPGAGSQVPDTASTAPRADEAWALGASALLLAVGLHVLRRNRRRA